MYKTTLLYYVNETFIDILNYFININMKKTINTDDFGSLKFCRFLFISLNIEKLKERNVTYNTNVFSHVPKNKFYSYKNGSVARPFFKILFKFY